MTCKDCKQYECCHLRIAYLMDVDCLGNLIVDIEKRCPKFTKELEKEKKE